MFESAIEKREVEELIGTEISNDLFHKALEYAKRKQAYIYSREKRLVVMQHWYLVKLAEEYARSLVLSKFTMDLCRKLSDMEKERQINNNLGAPQNTHIITVSAL